MVPTDELPPWTPFTYQFTAELGALTNVVENFCECDGRMQGACGVTKIAAGAVPLMPVPVRGIMICGIDELLVMTRLAL